MNKERIRERVELLLAAKEAYYNTEQALMSDEEFDRQEEELRIWEPEHAYFKMVGVPKEDGKIHHALPMLSMDKVKQAAGVLSWFSNLSKKGMVSEESLLCIQPKIDGVSASCSYRNGQLQYVATRGDGEFGQDISHIAQYIDQIPQKLHGEHFFEHFEVRGELYIPKDTTLNTNGKPLRNICSGLINRKEQSKAQSKAALQHLNFVAYQCPQTRLDHSEYSQIEKLATLGFHTVDAKLYPIHELAAYAQHYLDELRKTWNYETDGLIICIDDSRLFEAIDALRVVEHHHHYAIALKPPAESGCSILRGISWQVGRHGHLTPVAQFYPLRLASAMIERASLHNYANVERLKLQHGDILRVERSGDVIPYVRSNLGSPTELLASSGNRTLDCSDAGQPVDLKRAAELASELGQSAIPQNCPSCGGKLQLDSTDLFCCNRNCPEQIVQRTLFWIQRAGMDQIAEQSIRQLYKLGKLKNLQDLYRLSKEDLAAIPGYADKKIRNFVQQLQKSRRLDIQELVGRLSIPALQQRNLSKFGQMRRKSRWDLCIKLVAQHRHNKEQDLLKAMDSALAEVLPEWTISSDLGEQLLKKLLQQVESIFPKAKGLDARNKLSDNWNKKSGQVELWRNGFAIWEALLFERQPGFLELLSVADFIHFREPESRYSIINAFSHWIEENQTLLEELLPELEIIAVEPTTHKQKTICMTGNGPLPRKQLQEKLEAAGYTVVNQMSKSTHILLAPSSTGTSKKFKQAAADGIAIISYEDFLKDL